MANQRLTDKTELTTPALDDKFEVVDVSDTTQNPAGSTKWIKWSTLKSFFLKYTGLSDVLDTTLAGKEGQVPTVSSEIGGSAPKLKLMPIPSYTDLYSGNTVISGGVISPSPSTGLTYRVWASSFIINNVKYDEFVSANVTLNDGDPTDPRIDVFAIEVDTSADPPTFSVVVIEGTPDPDPVKPSVDLTNQVEVSFRVIAANQTTDSDTVMDLVYEEATGEPDEWNNTFLLPGANLTDTSDPYLGTVSLSVPTTTDNYVQWTNLTGITYSADQKLNLAVKLSAWNLGQTIEFKLIDTATNTYRILSINGINARDFGLDTTSTAWKLVQIPIVRFVQSSETATFDRIEIRFRKTAAMLLDWINIQSGLNQPPTFSYVKSVVAGSNIAVDNTDPERPIVSADLSDYSTTVEMESEIENARRLFEYTIGTLPTPVAGAMEYVTDGETYVSAAAGSTVSATGTTIRPVFYNGTNWIYV